jgi:D-alanyl-D-alanine carboxypeptidase/D-alanyl-D-alanine-endopeptidase (penicillin-binding protein 4)
MKYLLLIMVVLLASCSVEKKIAKMAETQVLQEPALSTAHIGISIFDVEKQQYMYNYQGDKFFVPASNTKLMMCYAAMKYLGDSIAGLIVEDVQNTLLLHPTGDPTLLHPDFKRQPVIDFLKKQNDKGLIYYGAKWKDQPLGFGWAWDDYESDYMAERSAMPIYGNVITVSGRKDSMASYPADFNKQFVFAENEKGYFSNISRPRSTNNFTINAQGRQRRELAIPFVTSDSLSVELLSHAISKDISLSNVSASNQPGSSRKIIYSQPTDSLLKITMHRSDNFFAEQTLLMVSDKILGVMSDAKIIDTLLKTDFASLPQKPKWVDGSGLSRYNLFSPQDFVTVLNKMQQEFVWNRITTILPTGGTGTISSYYKKYAGKIFAKTGTLSNNIALSGYLLTDSGKKLIFSVLVNNHQAPTATIRKDVENFLGWLIEKY